MTQKNLLDAMGRIDAKLITEAAPDTPFRKNTNKTWVKWGAIAACLALILSTIIMSSIFRKDDTFILPTDINNIIWSQNGDIPGIEMVIPLWEGWRVDSHYLYEQLEKAAPNQYFALHISKTFWDGFVYNGKTVAEILNEKEETNALVNKLYQFLKISDKWGDEQYEERFENFGEDFLTKYIAEGELNKALIEEDMLKAMAEAEKLEVMYDDAYKAYHSSYVNDTEKVFSDLGLCTIVKNNKLFIFVQKEKLANLDVADKGGYKLSLAKRRNYEYEEGDIPTYKTDVKGFALDKIECETFDHSSRFATNDTELIEKINALIKAGQFDTDRIKIRIASSEALSEDIFKDMNYESIHVTKKYKTSAFAWMYVKYENINLEALKELSNMKSIKSIHLYLESEGPDTEG